MAERRKTEEEEFREMELWEHLAELRGRIFRSLIYIAVGAVVVWIFYGPIWQFLWAPLKPIVDRYGAKGVGGQDGGILIDNITSMFVLKLQISLFGGLIAAVPLITAELWGFIAPGLTRKERRGFYFVGPMAVGFFLLGLLTSYLILPAAFGYFANFLKPQGMHVVFLPRVEPYILFVIKMSLAFGLLFELPVVLMFLGWVGIVSSQSLRAGWRYAVVGCALVAAIATPSSDVMTMMLTAAPLMVLYVLSIGLVAMVERIRGTRETAEWEASEPEVERIAPPGAVPATVGRSDAEIATDPTDETNQTGASH